MNTFWVVRDNGKGRNLCTDGMIRKNLRHAPEGVGYMRFDKRPSKSHWVAVTCKCQRVPSSFKPYEVKPEDYQNPRTGNIWYGILTKMNPLFTELVDL